RHRRSRGQNRWWILFQNTLSNFNLFNVRSIQRRITKYQRHWLPLYWLILIIIILVVINYMFGIFEITANKIPLPSQATCTDDPSSHIDTLKCFDDNISMIQNNLMTI
ncbi:unnamed protein product, partial [Rotaria sp. Silwood2]